ncbi:MAG: ASKHA domain-containing protein [Desulfuromonadales bacterium]
MMTGEPCVLAFDLGTTTLAARLLDRKGEVLAEGRLRNPQYVLGSDVVRRLEAAQRGEGERLQTLLVEGMDALLAELLRQADLSRQQVQAAAAAANPAVSHLLCRCPVDSLLYPPHKPVFRQGLSLEPISLGLDLPCALYLFPLVSGYVGGDLVAFLHAYPPQAARTLYLDVGTNGEMALYHEGRWLVTSVAAGPAFEAAGISYGMPLGEGAVEGIALEADRWALKVVGGGPARGLCGSGLAQVVALARREGLIDSRGTIVDAASIETNLSRYVVEEMGERSLRLFRDAVIDLRLTQQDIRSFQLAKGAIRAGVDCLLKRAGLEGAKDIQVMLTGALGLSLPSEVLKRVAMLPENMLENVHFVAGGALRGVGRMLLQKDGVAEVEGLARSLKPYPLSGTPVFEDAFIKSLDF